MALTLEEIDAALAKALQEPADKRGPVWDAWIDSLLEQRLKHDLANHHK